MLDDIKRDIESSSKYKEYIEIGKILDKDNNIRLLMNEIKELQNEASLLEYNDDKRFMELNNLIEKKVIELNNNKTYQEYLDRVNEFNKS